MKANMNPRTGTKIIKNIQSVTRHNPSVGLRMAYASVLLCNFLNFLSVQVHLFVCLVGVRKSPVGGGACGLSLCTDKRSVTSILLSYKFRWTLTNHQSTDMETATAWANVFHKSAKMCIHINTTSEVPTFELVSFPHHSILNINISSVLCLSTHRNILHNYLNTVLQSCKIQLLTNVCITLFKFYCSTVLI